MVQPENACFIEMTRKLLESKSGRIYNQFYEWKGTFDRQLIVEDEVSKVFDEVFLNKEKSYFHGDLLDHRAWLMNSNVPMKICERNGFDIEKILLDPDSYVMIGKNTTRSYLTMLGRKLCDGRNHISYLLERWSDDGKRNYPFFYFDFESVEWIWEELRRNKNQVRTMRASKSCCPNIFFRWNSELNLPIIGVVCKHNQWSHLYQDFFIPHMVGKVLLEMNLKSIKCNEFIGTILFVSSTMDDRKRAREIIKYENK